MTAERIDSLEIFLRKLCFSFAIGISQAPTSHVEFYNSHLGMLDAIQQNTYSHFIQGPSFSLREGHNFSEREEGIYYINVGHFIDLYERKKIEGENVIL
ncbi:MAG: hypothetical protein Q8Q31_01455 [Nanoarchaeota archaeon]|nr:hypothetical protein [Nanoarchaeota archaeon]